MVISSGRAGEAVERVGTDISDHGGEAIVHRLEPAEVGVPLVTRWAPAGAAGVGGLQALEDVDGAGKLGAGVCAIVVELEGAGRAGGRRALVQVEGDERGVVFAIPLLTRHLAACYVVVDRSVLSVVDGDGRWTK